MDSSSFYTYNEAAVSAYLRMYSRRTVHDLIIRLELLLKHGPANEHLGICSNLRQPRGCTRLEIAPVVYNPMLLVQEATGSIAPFSMWDVSNDMQMWSGDCGIARRQLMQDLLTTARSLYHDRTNRLVRRSRKSTAKRVQKWLMT